VQTAQDGRLLPSNWPISSVQRMNRASKGTIAHSQAIWSLDVAVKGCAPKSLGNV
jgi:hypothetical protein